MLALDGLPLDHDNWCAPFPPSKPTQVPQRPALPPNEPEHLAAFKAAQNRRLDVLVTWARAPKPWSSVVMTVHDVQTFEIL